MQKKAGNRKPGWLSCLVILILLPILVLGIFVVMGAVLVIADPLEKADAIVVLSGGEEVRLQEAISLYQEEYAETIILTETGAKVEGYNAQYSSEQRLYLIYAEIPSSAIQIIGKHAASTREEAKLVRTQTANTNIHTLIVVTDPYHTLRTRMIWKDVFKDSGIKIIVRPARGSWYKSTSWWMSTAGWENTISEYAKLLSYVINQKLE
jgi:uncharacterized SAM-binding protein YcdF (DUF218 family)